MKRLRDRIPGFGPSAQYYAWRGVSAVVGRLPLKVAYAAATAIGTVGYYTWPRGRKAMQANYAVVLPKASKRERARVARQSLVNYCRYLVDFVRFPAWTHEAVLGMVHGPQEYDRLAQEMEHGRGVVVVCMHFGNWDAGASACAARGFPLSVVAETFGDRRLDEMVVAERERLGMRIIKLESAGPSLLRVLKKGEVLALLIDRPLESDGVRVPFFGREIEVPAGPARLALWTRAKVLPTAFPRLEAGKPDVDTLCDWEVELPSTGDHDEDVRQLTGRIVAAHERFIRERPEQWYMFRRMWHA